MILFLSAGCHEFVLSKVILHVHIQNGWTSKPFTIFCASNIAMKRQKSSEHNNSELENSSSTQKNCSEVTFRDQCRWSRMFDLYTVKYCLLLFLWLDHSGDFLVIGERFSVLFFYSRFVFCLGFQSSK